MAEKQSKKTPAPAGQGEGVFDLDSLFDPSGRAAWPSMGSVRWPVELREAFKAEVAAEQAQGRLSNIQHLVLLALSDWLCSRPAHSDLARQMQERRGIALDGAGE